MATPKRTLLPGAPAAEAHIALLRAVNVAGHQAVGMAGLRDLLAKLGFTDVRSLLASGNLVFRGASARGPGSNGSWRRRRRSA